MRILAKPYRWAALYAAVLVVFTAYVLLDTFVIERIMTPTVSAVSAAAIRIQAETDTQADTADIDTQDETTDETQAEEQTGSGSAETGLAAAAVVTDTSYTDEHIQITLETLYVYNTAVYIADIQVSDAAYLETALAKNSYGRNITETTSSMAESNDAVFAVNGDYYGFRNDGYVIRNGVLYRSVSGDNEDLVIDSEGNFSIVEESEVTAQSLLDSGAWQVFSFGPALVNNGEIAVSANSEVGQSMSSNPRTAIGQISALHYLVIVSDGRTSESEGLSLLELAELFARRGCTVAYNLDGGGSATMWFNGKVVNNPTNGRSYGERSVSDIVYFE